MVLYLNKRSIKNLNEPSGSGEEDEDKKNL